MFLVNAALVSGCHSAGIFPACQDPAGFPGLLHCLKPIDRAMPDAFPMFAKRNCGES